jgi:thioredoxin-dependent peroxiredoxin
MTKITTVSSLIPNFNLSMTGSTKPHPLVDYAGHNIVLFFYPKDNTPVCTSEAKAFRDHFEKFQNLNTVIFGVSRDNLAAHEKFKTKLQLPFELISDTSEELCNYFNVIGEKSFFGKKIRGIIRSTFLIDENRALRQSWRKIKVSGHVDEVLQAITSKNQ